MMELSEYYNKLKQALNEAPLTFAPGEPQYAKPSEALVETLSPAVSYLLASKKSVHHRIGTMYNGIIQQAASSIPKEKLAEYDIPELEATLTLAGRLRYKQVLVCCLADLKTAADRLLQLMVKAYPENQIKESDAFGIWIAMACGAYAIEHISATFLMLILEGKRILSFCNHDTDGFIAFKYEAIRNMPLPYWAEIPDLQIRDTISLGHTLAASCALPYEERSLEAVDFFTRELKRNDDKRKQIVRDIKAAPFATRPALPDEVLPEFGLLPKQALRAAQQILKNKNITERKHAVEDREEKKADGSMTAFLLACIKREALSIEELLDFDITPDVSARIAGAALDALDRPITMDCYVAGALVSALANRAVNEANTASRLLDAAVDDDVMGINKTADTSLQPTASAVEQPETNAADEELNALQEEIAALKGKLAAQKNKNQSLSETINRIKKENEGVIRRMEADNKSLKETCERKQQEIDDLMLLTADDGQDDYGMSVEEMKTAVAGKRLLFVSGHDTWQATMRQEFPRAKFVKAGAFNTIEKSLLADVECVIYNVKMGAHSLFNKCRSVMRDDTRLVILNTNNTEATIRRIYRGIYGGRGAAQKGE